MWYLFRFCIVIELLTGSCLSYTKRTNGVIQCNILKVTRVGGIQRYKNERVLFTLKNDSLMIKSSHVSLSLVRMRHPENAYVIRNSSNNQFMFIDRSKELYEVLYIQNGENAKLYLYIVNIKHLKPAYMFTNDPDFNPSSQASLGQIIAR